MNNNIIIKGLERYNLNVFERAEQFLPNEFDVMNAVADVREYGPRTSVLSVRLNSHLIKNKIMRQNAKFGKKKYISNMNLQLGNWKSIEQKK